MKSHRQLVAILAIAILSGCATGWQRVDATDAKYTGKHYSAVLPAGWMRQVDIKGNLVASRDGIGLQRIVIMYRPHEQAFEDIERASSASMLPSELAELMIADLKAGEEDGLPGLEILRNEPVVIAGHTGFGLHLRYKTDDGLRMEVLVNGCVDEDGFYALSFHAPTLHYFERDREVFESVSRSLRTL